MKLPGMSLRLSNQGLENDKEATMFELLKTKMTTWAAQGQHETMGDMRHSGAAACRSATRSPVTRTEIAALFATELASSARRI